MIIMYPLLVSNTVSNDILPALTKVLEKFVLLYRMDDVLDYYRRWDSHYFSRAVSTGLQVAKLAASKEYEIGKYDFLSEQHDDDNDDDDDDNLPVPTGGGGWGRGNLPTSRTKTSASATIDPYLKKIGQATDVLQQTIDVKAGKVEFKPPNKDSLTLEPTWVNVTHPKYGSRIIGVKVLPFPIASEYNLAYYLMSDKSTDLITSFLKEHARNWYKNFWNLMSHVPIVKLFLKKTITGDPRRDILHGQTLYHDNVFCMINYNDEIAKDVLKNPALTKKLHDMGWNSLVFADDINRRAIFCMKEFQGLCSTISYQIMGASFGSEEAKVFNSMEEVRKSAASFFSLKQPKNFKVESKIIEDYLNTLFEGKSGRSK